MLEPLTPSVEISLLEELQRMDAVDLGGLEPGSSLFDPAFDANELIPVTCDDAPIPGIGGIAPQRASQVVSPHKAGQPQRLGTRERLRQELGQLRAVIAELEQQRAELELKCYQRTMSEVRQQLARETMDAPSHEDVRAMSEFWRRRARWEREGCELAQMENRRLVGLVQRHHVQIMRLQLQALAKQEIDVGLLCDPSVHSADTSPSPQWSTEPTSFPASPEHESFLACQADAILVDVWLGDAAVDRGFSIIIEDERMGIGTGGRVVVQFTCGPSRHLVRVRNRRARCNHAAMHSELPGRLGDVCV